METETKYEMLLLSKESEEGRGDVSDLESVQSVVGRRVTRKLSEDRESEEYVLKMVGILEKELES